MKNITLDTGIEEFAFQGGGVLRFNPCDPNLYARFLEVEQDLQALEQELNEAAKQENGTDALVRLSRQADQKAKALLNRIFAGANDFDQILGGVSLLAVAGNGRRVIANLMETLEGILTDGAARFASNQADAIRAKQ